MKTVIFYFSELKFRSGFFFGAEGGADSAIYFRFQIKALNIPQDNQKIEFNSTRNTKEIPSFLLIY